MSSPFIEASTESLARALFDTSWQVAALVLLVFALQRLAKRRLSARWSYAMWLVVIVRLALFPIAPLEVSRQANPLLWRPPVLGTSPEATPTAQPRALSTSRAPLRASLATVSSAPGAVAELKQPGTTKRAHPKSGSFFEPPPHLGSAAPLEPERTPWTQYALILWLAGALLALLRVAFLELRFRRRWTHLPSLQDDRLQAALEHARERTGLAHAPRLIEADFLRGPAVAGLRAPALLVPPGFASDLDDRALQLVLLHELFHLRRRDVHANALFALVRSLFWFHPLAHFALARLFAERECLRDWEALAAAQNPEPRSYAKTLLGLVEASAHKPTPLTSPLFLPSFRKNPDLEKRLLMITRFTPRTHRSWALGSILCLTLGWLGFTGPLSAAQGSTPNEPARPNLVKETPHTPSRPSSTGRSIQRLSVEHATTETEWHRDLRLKLNEQVTGKIAASSLDEALRQFSENTGVNIMLSLSPNQEYDEPIELDYGATAEAVLDYLLDMVDQDLMWSLSNRTVLVGLRGTLPISTELVMYSISPIIDLGIGTDDLITATIELTGSWDNVWDNPGYSIEEYEDRLFIRADYRTQAKVEAFLTRCLNFEEETEAEAGASALTEMDKVLLDVDYTRRPLTGVIQELSDASDFTVTCDEAFLGEDLYVDLHLKQASLFDVLSLISFQLDKPLVELKNGASLGYERRAATTYRLYPIEDVLANFDDEEGANDTLVMLIQETTGGAFWDSDLRGMIFPLGPYLVVQATPSIHAEIETLLNAFSRLES